MPPMKHWWLALVVLHQAQPATGAGSPETTRPRLPPHVAQPVWSDFEGARRMSKPSIDVAKYPLESGVPTILSDLIPGKPHCSYAAVPKDTDRILVLASVVALAGSPDIAHGWSMRPPPITQENSWHTIEEEIAVPPQGARLPRPDKYWFCVVTGSPQGCDAILTVSVTDASEEFPALRVKLGFPAMWNMGKSPVPDELQFLAQSDGLQDLRVTAIPVSGEIDVMVFDDPKCSGDPMKTSQLVGPDLIEILHTEIKAGLLCIKAKGTGVLHLTVGPRVPGPFLTPAVAFAGQFEKGVPSCEFAQLLVNDGTDMTLTATAEDGSDLTMSASMPMQKWTGSTPPGGTGAVLFVKGQEVAEAEGLTSARGEVTLSVMVCRTPPTSLHGSTASAQATKLWLTAMTDSGVIMLKDAVPVITTLEYTNGMAWREFRFLVKGGSTKPEEVTISAESTGTAFLMADTKPHPHRWLAPNSSTPVIHLTTVKEMETPKVHFLNCHLPCFVYIAASAQVPDDPEAQVDLKVTATAGGGDYEPATKDLQEGQPVKQTLPTGASQVYAYRLRSTDTSVSFSVSKDEGEVTFRISASPDFPEGAETTTPAHDVILLEPWSKAYASALQKATATDSSAVLYASVTAKRKSTFSILARTEGEAKLVHNGEVTEGAVKAQHYDTYRFWIGKEEVENPTDISIEVSPLTGKLSAYVSCTNESPTSERGTSSWSKIMNGQDSIVFQSTSPKFKPGWVYASVTSESAQAAAYRLRVRWGNYSVDLHDGVEEVARLESGTYRFYTFGISHKLEVASPAAVRVQAFVGSVGLCLYAPAQPKDRRLRPTTSGSAAWDIGCWHSAVANASAHHPEQGLAAIDIDPTFMDAGSVIEMKLVTLGPAATNFAIRAQVAAPATLSETHFLIVDALGPSCCIEGAEEEQLLTRRYLHYVRDPQGSTRVQIRALGGGKLAGATLRARRSGVAVDIEEKGARGKSQGLVGPDGWTFSAVADRRPSPSAKDDEAVAVPDDTLSLTVDHASLAQSRGHGFWLEVGVEVLQPLTFTLGLTPPSDDPTRLVPNVMVMGNLSHVSSSARYEFSLAGAVEDGKWRLRLRQCYGRVRLELPYTDRLGGQQEDTYEGVDAEVPLATTQSKRRKGGGDEVTDGSAVVTPLTDPFQAEMEPVFFEVELLPPVAGESLILLPAQTAVSLSPKSSLTGSLFFNFQAAEVNAELSDMARRLLSNQSAEAGAPMLKYRLVAVPTQSSLANPDSSCGLEEALRRKEAIAGKIFKAGAGQHRGLLLEAALPPEAGKLIATGNQSWSVNVLATLVGPTGNLLEARSYQAFELNATSLSARSHRSTAATNFFGALVVVGAAVACWSAVNKRLCFKEARELQPLEQPAIELESPYAPYDLQQDPDRAVLLQPRSHYVPPSM